MAVDLLAAAYENARPEVQAHIPLDAGRILDLGCSSGRLGEAIKARQPAEVVGVELEPVYADAARRRLDQVIVADLERLFAEVGAADGLGSFDCVVVADVLEHLRDPGAVLAAARSHLRPGGTVVISLPNVRYWHTFWMLGVRGTWPRDDFGICDRTHLRFFTLGDALELLTGAGLRVGTVAPVLRLHPWRTHLRCPEFLRRRPFAPFFAYQYVIAARA